MSNLNHFNKIYHKYKNDGLISLLRAIIYDVPISKVRKSPVIRGDKQFDLLTMNRYRFQKVIYNMPAKPYNPIYISPNEIGYENHEINKEWGLGQIHSGDWDISGNCNTLESNRVYKGLKQRFEEAKDWEETIYYQEAKSWFNDGGARGYENIDQYLEIRCNYVDKLYKNIRDDGYRPNYSAEHDVPSRDIRSSKTSFANRLEPLVVIGRNGNIYWRSGFHRLSIANILDIEKIPVNVLARHRQWQQTRDEVYESGTGNLASDVLNNHPDLQDVLRPS